MPPPDSIPLKRLPHFALAAANDGNVDAVVRKLYDAVRAAGGEPAGQGKGGCQFTLGLARAKVDLTTGWTRVWTDAGAEVQQPTELQVKLRRFIPHSVTYDTFCHPEPPVEPAKPCREGLVWQLKPFSDPIEYRLLDINTAIEVLRRLAGDYREAVETIFERKAVKVFVRMDSTSTFLEVHPDALPDAWLDWANMRLHLADQRVAEQVVFSPIVRRERGAGHSAMVDSDELQRCIRIGEAILKAFPDGFWPTEQIVAFMLEIMPGADEKVCRDAFQLLKSKMPARSRWRIGGRPSGPSLREAMLPHLVRQGLVEPP